MNTRRARFPQGVLWVATLVFALVLSACSTAYGADTRSEASPDTKVKVGATYEWIGVIERSGIEAPHLELQRGCDTWVLMAQSSEVAKKRQNYAGQKVVVWGTVFEGASIFMRQAITAQSIFGPNDPMPMTLMAVPSYPCPGNLPPVPPAPPQPRDAITLSPSDMAAAGTLIWESGKAYLSTPSGRIILSLPIAASASPQDGKADGSEPASAQPGVLDVTAAGRWGLQGGGVSMAARTVRPSPVSIIIGNTCNGTSIRDQLQPGEAAFRGTMVTNTDRPYLKAEGGPVWLSFLTPMLTASPMAVQDAVVVGKWKVGSDGPYVSVRNTGLMAPACPPPPPPPTVVPGLMPGEIAAVGVLVWENSQPYLETPSGKILLFGRADATTSTSGAVEGIAPDEWTRPMRRQVMAIGKWQIRGGQLAITARTLVPWGPDPAARGEPAPIEPARMP